MHIALFLILLIPATFTSLTFYIFYRDQGIYDIVGIYTLVSSLLILILSFSSLMYCYCYEKKYGDFECRYDCYHISLIIFILTWAIFSLFVLYSSAHLFPDASSYGGFTIFYQILFSLSYFVGFILLLFQYGDENKKHQYLVPTFMIPLVALCIAIFLEAQNSYLKYTFLTYNIVAAILGTFLGVMMGCLVHSKFKYNLITQAGQLYQLYLFGSLGAIGFPLLPASAFLNFILVVLKDNIFEGETRTFASLTITSVYFLAIAGFAGYAFHNGHDLESVRFSNQLLVRGAKAIYQIPQFHSIFQIITLSVFFVFSEEQLPFYAYLATYFALFLIITQWLLQCVCSRNIKHFTENIGHFTRNLWIAHKVRLILLMIDIVLCSTFLGMAQKTSNIFYSFPRFSLFMLLCICYFSQLALAVVPFQTWKLDDMSFNANLILIMNRAPQQPPFQQLIEEDLQVALQNVEDDQILEEIGDQNCAICLSGLYRGTFFEENGFNLEVSKIKKCGHYFHTKCIKDWLVSKRTCPIDRRTA